MPQRGKFIRRSNHETSARILDFQVPESQITFNGTPPRFESQQGSRKDPSNLASISTIHPHPITQHVYQLATTANQQIKPPCEQEKCTCPCILLLTDFFFLLWYSISFSIQSCSQSPFSPLLKVTLLLSHNFSEHQNINSQDRPCRTTVISIHRANNWQPYDYANESAVTLTQDRSFSEPIYSNHTCFTWVNWGGGMAILHFS